MERSYKIVSLTLTLRSTFKVITRALCGVYTIQLLDRPVGPTVVSCERSSNRLDESNVKFIQPVEPTVASLKCSSNWQLDQLCKRKVCAIRLINIHVIISKPHFTVYFVVYTSMFVYIVFIIFAALVTLGGRLFSTNPASSAKNVLISAWFFRAAYSS